MPNSPIAPRLLSQKEAAHYLGISYWTLRDLLFRNEIPYVRVKRRLLVDRLDLDGFIHRSKTPIGG